MEVRNIPESIAPVSHEIIVETDYSQIPKENLLLRELFRQYEQGEITPEFNPSILPEGQQVSEIASVTPVNTLLHFRGESMHNVQGVTLGVRSGGTVEVSAIMKQHQYADQEFQNNRIALERGVKTTIPLFYLSKKETDALKIESKVIFIQYDPNLQTSSVLDKTFWEQRREGEELTTRELFLQKVATEFGLLHGKGIIHNDPQLKNIAFDQGSPDMALFFFDWESAEIPIQFTEGNILPLEEVSPKNTIGSDFQRFFSSYIQSFGSPFNMLSDLPLPDLPNGLHIDKKIIEEAQEAYILYAHLLRSPHSIKTVPEFLETYKKILAPYIDEDANNFLKDSLAKQLQNSALNQQLLKALVPIKKSFFQTNVSRENQFMQLQATFKKIGLSRLIKSQVKEYGVQRVLKNVDSLFFAPYYESLQQENPQVYALVKPKKDELETYARK